MDNLYKIVFRRVLNFSTYGSFENATELLLHNITLFKKFHKNHQNTKVLLKARKRFMN